MRDGGDGIGALMRKQDEQIAEIVGVVRDVSGRLDATTRGLEAVVERLEQVEAGQTAISAGREQAA